MTCTISGRRFQVDTGAQVSVISATWMNKRAGSICQPLQAANGTSILTFGGRIVPSHFGGRRYSARLIQADVKRAPGGTHGLSYWYQKDGELFVCRAKPEETLVDGYKRFWR